MRTILFVLHLIAGLVVSLISLTVTLIETIGYYIYIIAFKLYKYFTKVFILYFGKERKE